MTGAAPARAIPRRITLLTDFGTEDGYAAALRGVLATLVPDVLVEDISHAMGHGDIAAAAWCLTAFWDRYPPGTVHVVVVDPGVGGARRGLAVEAEGRFGVGPDNGVLDAMLAAPGARAAQLDRPALWATTVSPTFHGRDIFAPVAAHLAVTRDLSRVGTPVGDPVRLPDRPPDPLPTGWRGVVVHADRFGNLITNLTAGNVPPGAVVRIGGVDVGPLRTTYADVAPGCAVALIGSGGRLEVAVRDGNAAQKFGARPGATIEVTRS